jgi:hypothetical protein
MKVLRQNEAKSKKLYWINIYVILADKRGYKTDAQMNCCCNQHGRGQGIQPPPEDVFVINVHTIRIIAKAVTERSCEFRNKPQYLYSYCAPLLQA